MTKDGIQKLENIHNEMVRCIIHANRLIGIPNVPIQGELVWTNIFTKTATGNRLWTWNR